MHDDEFTLLPDDESRYRHPPDDEVRYSHPLLPPVGKPFREMFQDIPGVGALGPSDKHHIQCPRCDDQDDESLFVNTRDGFWKCGGCGVAGSGVDRLAKMWPIWWMPVAEGEVPRMMEARKAAASGQCNYSARKCGKRTCESWCSNQRVQRTMAHYFPKFAMAQALYVTTGVSREGWGQALCLSAGGEYVKLPGLKDRYLVVSTAPTFRANKPKDFQIAWDKFLRVAWEAPYLARPDRRRGIPGDTRRLASSPAWSMKSWNAPAVTEQGAVPFVWPGSRMT